MGEGKPWKQKGTGRARAGTIRSPLWRGGGVTFAATPRDYSKKINKKMYRAALRSIWSKLAEEEKIIAINDISIESQLTNSYCEGENANGSITLSNITNTTGDLIFSWSATNVNEFNVQTISSIDPSLLFKAKKV